MFKTFFAILLLFSPVLFADNTEPQSPLFEDLKLVDTIDKKMKERLPFYYNYSMIGGYFTMPSARMAPTGTLAIGAGSVPPYNIYGVNFQVFNRVELAGNYRVFRGVMEGNFGHEGFGDDADRIGNIKIGVLIPEDDFPMLPSIAVGADDFFGTKRFHSQYVVVTKEWIDQNVEVSLGWGRKRFKGLFGGIGWSPFRKTQFPLLKDLSLLVEYDCIDYKHHHHEHPKGTSVKTRINAGLTLVAADILQISVSSLRGEKVAASASIRYPLGTSKGFFPKIDDPLPYTSPVDTEPLGITRPKEDFIQQLAYEFSDQGLDLYSAYLSYDEGMQKLLWLKVVNNRYRDEPQLRARIQDLLCAVTPIDIAAITVVLEADGLACQSYRFRREDLERYRLGITNEFELETVSPMREATAFPNVYEAALLFERKKDIWTFTVKPRLLSFFGSAQGKYKYALSAVATPEGYLFDEIYYRMQFSYNVKSSIAGLAAQDRLNPSQLINVRTDTLKYFQTNSVSVEQAYIQKGWNLRKGFFSRLSGGYFEPAYGGVALEFLYYPVNSDWAVGIEAATVAKRKYKGLGYTTKIRKLHHHQVHYVGFVGLQYFLDVYYDFTPLCLDFKLSLGQFLARDLGGRLEVSRYFASGLRFSLWYTLTNGHDKVNGHTYHDKGFAFLIPLDMFLKQSSRNYIGYAMSAWLRDVGARADTGKTLYETLSEERYLP